MKPGGSFNTRVHQNDLNEIQSGYPPAAQLLLLPLYPWYRSGTTANGVATSPTPYGARPDLRTLSGRNPIVSNLGEGNKLIAPFRIQLQQPTNSIQMLWHALDAAGNYVCSYPINSASNTGVAGTTPAWPATIGTAANAQYWAFGWLRLNGIGPWFPMSLFPSHGIDTGALTIRPFGGFSSINAPMSFLDWVGYWDGVGTIADGPNGASNPYLLAVATSNLSLSSASGSLGQVNNYASPNGSGPESPAGNYDSTRAADVLLKAGGGNNGG